jgi:hypothetical protein
LKYEGGKYTDRRPSDPNEIFKPGNFEVFVSRYLETVDLIFREGINWQALDKSLEKFREENNGVGLIAQSIEHKLDSFVVKFAMPPDSEVDKGAIETFLKQEYDRELKVIEDKYRAKLSAKDQEILAIERKHNANLNNVIEMMATRPVIINNTNQNTNIGRDNNLNANNSIVSMGDMSGGVNNNVVENSDTSESNYDMRGSNIGNMADTNQGNQIADQHNS